MSPSQFFDNNVHENGVGSHKVGCHRKCATASAAALADLDM